MPKLDTRLLSQVKRWNELLVLEAGIEGDEKRLLAQFKEALWQASLKIIHFKQWPDRLIQPILSLGLQWGIKLYGFSDLSATAAYQAARCLRKQTVTAISLGPLTTLALSEFVLGLGGQPFPLLHLRQLSVEDFKLSGVMPPLQLGLIAPTLTLALEWLAYLAEQSDEATLWLQKCNEQVLEAIYRQVEDQPVKIEVIDNPAWQTRFAVLRSTPPQLKL